MSQEPMSLEQGKKWATLFQKLKKNRNECAQEGERIVKILLEEGGFDGDMIIFTCVVMALHADLDTVWATLASALVNDIKTKHPSDVPEVVVAIIDMTQEIAKVHCERIVEELERAIDEVLKEE